jgi:hypothetical protein
MMSHSLLFRILLVCRTSKPFAVWKEDATSHIGERVLRRILNQPWKFFILCQIPLNWHSGYFLHCNGNSVYIFLFWELRGLSPSLHIHVSVSDLQYIFPGSVHIFPPAEKADLSWEYIIRSQTHECGNWDWGPGIPFLGIFVLNFRHFVFAV